MATHPKIRNSLNRQHLPALIMVIFALQWCSNAHAIDGAIAISVGSLYTDNLFLDDTDKEDDFVGVIAPGLVLFHQTPRVDFEFDYLFEGFWYADASKSSSNASSGRTKLDLTLVPDRFFLDSAVTVDQTIKDARRPIPDSNVALTNNRSDFYLARTTPRWEQPIFSALMTVKAEVGVVDYDDSDLLDSDYFNTSIRLVSEPRDRGLNWNIRHRYFNRDYVDTTDYKRQEAMLEMGYALSFLTPFAAIGAESSYEDTGDSKLDDTAWLAGLRRRTSRTFMEAYYGDRNFGHTAGASFIRKLNDQGALSASYFERVSRQEDVLRGRTGEIEDSPETGLEDIPPGLDAAGTGITFVRSLATLRWEQAFQQNSFDIVLFYEKRDQRLDPDSNALPQDAIMYGIRPRWTYRIGPRTEFIFSGTYFQQEIEDPIIDETDTNDNVFLRFELARNLGEHFRAVLSYLYVDRNADETFTPGDVTRPYTLNQVGLILTYAFGRERERAGFYNLRRNRPL